MAQTILLIEYEPRTITRVSEALAPLECQIVTAKDVDAAVGACARVEPRLALITSMQPRLKVEDAITQVRARAGLRNTPFVVLVSGYTGNDREADAARLGAQALVPKPFSNEELLATAQGLLQAQRAPGTMGIDTKADVLEALRRSAGLASSGGTVTSEDLFGDLIGDSGDEERSLGDTQRLQVTAIGNRATPQVLSEEPPEPEGDAPETSAPPEQAAQPSSVPEEPAKTQRIPLESVMEAAQATPRPAKPAPRASSSRDDVVESSLAGMFETPAKSTRVREDTGGASVDELLHQTLSGLDVSVPRRKASPPPPTAPQPSPPPPAVPPPVTEAEVVEGDEKEAEETLPPVPAGVPFGQYELIETISTGGMAEVFKARMRGVEGFQKIVAIKRILPHLSDNDEFVTMFIDEAKLAAQLQHPNIIHIYDLGKIERSYYIAMEYIDGKDLRTILRLADEKERRVPLGLTLYVVSRLASALEYAHRKSDMQGRAMALVHRDVSPQNVLVSFDGEIKLCDFGIAKAASKASHTRAGALKGKLQYMSPEQAWGKDLDHRSDIFSLGLVLYEMLTGRKAFVGDSELSILEQVRSPKLTPPREIDPDIPEQVEALVMKALMANRDERYQTAAELTSAMEGVLQDFRPTPGSTELGHFVSDLSGKPREETKPAAPAPKPKQPAPPAPEPPKPKPSPEVKEAPPKAPEPERAVPPPVVTSIEPPARKSLPVGLIAGIAAIVVVAVIGTVWMTRQRGVEPDASVVPTPSAETVAMARQLAQEEVDRQEAALRDRLAQEVLGTTSTASTPVPAAVPTTGPPPAAAPTAAPAAAVVPPPATATPRTPPEPTALPASQPGVPTESPEPPARPTTIPPTATPRPLPTRAPAPPAQPAVRVGDLVDAPDTQPEVVLNPKPDYPPLAARQRIGGTVILRALVDETGAVQQVEILRGIKPDLGLDAAAENAVREWRFRPATKDGVRVKVWQTLTIPFRP